MTNEIEIYLNKTYNNEFIYNSKNNFNEKTLLQINLFDKNKSYLKTLEYNIHNNIIELNDKQYQENIIKFILKNYLFNDFYYIHIINLTNKLHYDINEEFIYVNNNITENYHYDKIINVEYENFLLKNKVIDENDICLHKQCHKCNGTGYDDINKKPCVHYISCPCSKCNPIY